MGGTNRCRKQQIAPRGESSQRPCFQARGRAKEGGARMRHHFFITGTDAGVGKTVLSALLCAALDAVYWKPIQTGTLEGSDRATVMRLAGIGTDRTIDEVYKFVPPVSPDLAARWAGVEIDLARINLPNHLSNDWLVVEGAGGVLVPINQKQFVLDLMVKLKLPVILAARSTLGTINHTLLTLAALHAAELPVHGAVSSWWVNVHGHANPRIAAAIAEQARKMEHVILAGFTHEPAEELASRLGKWVAPELTHLFFSDDGSTAVEVALKLAVQHFSNLGLGEKREIVALEHGYHGDTAGAMSVSDDSPFTEPFRAMRYKVHRVHSAYCYRCPVGLRRESCHIECVTQLETLLAERGDKIAAVIVEPLLQAAGGMVVHPVEFLQNVRALCTAHDILLIADEVLTGFGRTGKMFACDLAGVVPDLMCLSKGITGGFLPMGVTLSSERVESAFRSENRQHTFYHGHSYTGNAMACSAG